MDTTTAELVASEDKRDLLGRQYTGPAEGERVLEAFATSGMALRAFAQREGIKYSTFVSHDDRVSATAVGTAKFDDLILECPFGAIDLVPALDPVARVVLGPGDPEYTPGRQVEKMAEIDVGLVENDNLAGLEPGTKADRTPIIVVGGLFDDGDARKEILRIAPHVKLGGGLATAALGPVNAIGHQGNFRGINCIDCALETPGQSAVTARRPWTRRQSLQVAQRRPE